MYEIDLLRNGYYIEYKNDNYTLRQRYTGRTKDGKPKEAVRTFGHHNNIRGAIEKYIKLCQDSVLDGERLTLEEYVKSIDTVNKAAVQGLEHVLERYPGK